MLIYFSFTLISIFYFFMLLLLLLLLVILLLFLFSIFSFCSFFVKYYFIILRFPFYVSPLSHLESIELLRWIFFSKIVNYEVVNYFRN